MTRRILTILAILLSIGAFRAMPARAEFEDVPRDHWAYDAVSFLEGHGFVVGYPDGTFQGDRVLTRYEFAMVVSRLYDEFMQRNQSQDNPATIDEQGVMDMLMREFQPDIDRLRDLIDVNTARIGVVEGTTEQLSTKMSDLTTRINGMGGNTLQTSGDLRVRFEGIYPSSGLQTQRPRYRLRWGFIQPITPELKFGARLASGSLWASTSTNQTMEHNFGMAGINIDRAYLQYTPASNPGFTVWAGKFQPPWRNTPLVWDSDVNVEGLAQQWTSGDYQVTLGELVPNIRGFYLVAQAGANNLGVDGLSAFATYHWINEDAWSAISANMHISDKNDPFYLKSNWAWDRLDNPTDYRAIEGYLQYKGNLGTTPITITADYLRNLADAATPAEGEESHSAWTQAASVEMAVMNTPANVGEWQLKGEYGRSQANSTLTWLADSDRGGSDYQWWVGSLLYRFMRNTDFVITYYSRDRISKDSSDQIIHVDIMTKF